MILLYCLYLLEHFETLYFCRECEYFSWGDKVNVVLGALKLTVMGNSKALRTVLLCTVVHNCV